MITELDNGFISDSFEIEQNGYTFSDALVMLQEEYDTLSNAEISELKQQRFDNWYAIITAIPDE
jgi:hypothetical protein